MTKENDLNRKIHIVRINLEVCSILLAALIIFLSLGFKELEKLPLHIKISIMIPALIGFLFLLMATIIMADSGYYYAKGNTDIGSNMGDAGYSLMRRGLFFAVLTFCYVIFAILPFRIEAFDVLSIFIEMGIPLAVGAVPYALWRKWKKKKLK